MGEPKILFWEVKDEAGRIVSSYSPGDELLALRLMNKLQREKHSGYTVEPVWEEPTND